ncbi:MAG: hypothetical protein ABIH21_05750 [Patescibacteria group bacterium]
MSRVEKQGEQFAIAFGVDHLPDIGAFVMVWDHTIFEQPFDEGEEGGTNIVLHLNNTTLEGDRHLDEREVLKAARKYGIEVTEAEVYAALD